MQGQKEPCVDFGIKLNNYRLYYSRQIKSKVQNTGRDLSPGNPSNWEKAPKIAIQKYIRNQKPGRSWKQGIHNKEEYQGVTGLEMEARTITQGAGRVNRKDKLALNNEKQGYKEKM